MKRFLAAAMLVLTSASPALPGTFVGELKFTDPGCKLTKHCILAENFGYIDSYNQGWEAQKDNKSDGASVPPAVRDWIGHPFDDDLIRAAVIHDHYCDRKVNTWSYTHWVFYDALLTSGVERRRARLMYAAVLLGGPFWIRVEKGTSCTTGRNCVMTFDAELPQFDGATTTTGFGGTYISRPARYTDPNFKAELDALERQIDNVTGVDERGEIEALVKGLRPEDDFLTGPDTIVVAPGGGIAE